MKYKMVFCATQIIGSARLAVEGRKIKWKGPGLLSYKWILELQAPEQVGRETIELFGTNPMNVLRIYVAHWVKLLPTSAMIGCL